jgi:hypothetical protein
MKFETRRAAMDEPVDHLVFYNRKRLHTALGYKNPMACEKIWRRQQNTSSAKHVGGIIPRAMGGAARGRFRSSAARAIPKCLKVNLSAFWHQSQKPRRTPPRNRSTDQVRTRLYYRLIWHAYRLYVKLINSSDE